MSFLRLVKRNILVYSREKANVFFSLLSMLIIILLMSLFLGNMNVDQILSLLKEHGGTRDLVRDTQNAKNLIIQWSVAGIIVVNSVTITLAMVGNMVDDQDSNKMSSFFVSPLNRSFFVMAYIAAAFVVGVIMCTFTFIISQVVTVLMGGALLSLGQIIKVLLLIIVNVFTFASLGLFMAIFIQRRSAFSGLSVIVGTLVGFLATIYVPIGSLPAKVQTVLKCIPLLHGSSLIRDVFSESALESTFSNCPQQLIDEYSRFMGITINWNDQPISNIIKVLFLLACGIIFIITSAIILKKRNALDR